MHSLLRTEGRYPSKAAALHPRPQERSICSIPDASRVERPTSLQPSDSVTRASAYPRTRMQALANERKVPSGWSGFRNDVAHYCQSAGHFREKLTILAKSRGLWALGFYRFGRWVYDPSSEHSRLGRVAWKGVHLALREAVLRLTRMNLAVQAEIGERVWLGTFDSIQIGGDVRIGDDCRLFGSNTLG